MYYVLSQYDKFNMKMIENNNSFKGEYSNHLTCANFEYLIVV